MAQTMTAPATTGVTVAVSEVDLNGPLIERVIVTVRNTSKQPMRKIVVEFDGPIGWTVDPEQQALGSLRPGAAGSVRFDLRVPAPREGFRVRVFTATVRYAGGDGAGSATGTRVQRTGEPLADLAAGFNNVGITDLNTIANGQFDGEGNSFSAQQLAGLGLTPGASTSALGATLSWPASAAGSPDNVSCGGQAIRLTGSGSKLVFLGSGSGLSAVGPATVYYTDGTITSGAVGFPNWSFQAADTHGATLVAACKGRNTPGGYANAEYDYRVFANSIPLDAGKTVDMVVLPGNASLHVFAMALAP